MERVILKAREERRILAGHLWIFSNEIEGKPDAGPGDLVEVLTHGGQSLGSGFYHPHSLIAVRLLDTGSSDIDVSFFEERLAVAARLRRRLFPQEGCYRLVHGESDFLPGLIVDRYGDCLALQSLTAGMDRRQDLICEALEGLFSPRVIVERNDTPLRQYEELPEKVGIFRGSDPGAVEVEENGIRYEVDLLKGQKTGFFLDQKLNRRALAPLCAGASVLDCFCNVGTFALNAARGGASRVLAVDSSRASISQGRRNAALNGFAQVEFLQGNVFEFLERQVRDGERYGVIVLDPPSFTRSKKNVAPARRAYRRLNEMACRCLEAEGFLVTASCSFHIFEEAFLETVQEAARRAGRRLRLLEWRHQSPDHPILPAMPETRYLKLGVFQVL